MVQSSGEASQPADRMTGSGVTDGRRQDWFRTSQERKRRAPCSICPGFARRAIPGGKDRNELAATREKIGRSRRDLAFGDHRPLPRPELAVRNQGKVWSLGAT